MIDLELVQMLKDVIALVLAYLCIAGIAGGLQAWIAHKVGDDTALDHGFMTINPFVHVDPISLFLLPIGYLLFRVVVGLSRPVPIAWHLIDGRVRRLKISLVALAQPLAVIGLLIAFLLMRLLAIVGMYAWGWQAYIPVFVETCQYLFNFMVGFGIWFIPYQLLLALTQLYVFTRLARGISVRADLLFMIVPLVGALLLLDVSRMVLLYVLTGSEAGLFYVGKMLFASLA